MSKVDVLRTFFDEVEFKAALWIVRKKQTDDLTPDCCVKKIQSLFPSAMVIDSFSHQGYIVVELFC